MNIFYNIKNISLFICLIILCNLYLNYSNKIEFFYLDNNKIDLNSFFLKKYIYL